MVKVVINACYGGFSLSHEAIMRYAEIAGITLYLEQDKRFSYFNYWTKLKEERKDENGGFWYDRDLDRSDPILVQVVEEMGEKSWGGCAELKVIEIPDGVTWEIDEYDGFEQVEEAHRTWS